MEIIFEDKYIIVANKPSGIATLPDKSTEKSLIDYLSEKQELWPVNRIDKRVSGLVVFAKSSQDAAKFNAELAAGKVKKFYRAITTKIAIEKEGRLVHFITKDSKNKIARMSTAEDKTAQMAELTYKIINKSEKYQLLEIDLITGRFHQIRLQLSALGCPILGDLKYGAKRSSPDGSLFLQCYQLEFQHPSTKKAIKLQIQQPHLWAKYGF
jgi:23S rRNA pseudouridine1911/1915/1917 synthase